MGALRSGGPLTEMLLISDSRTNLNIMDGVVGASPLMRAVLIDHVDCVELLTSDAHNDPNIKYDDDVSTLIMAVKLNRVEWSDTFNDVVTQATRSHELNVSIAAR